MRRTQEHPEGRGGREAADPVIEAARAVHLRLGKRRPVESYEMELVEELRMRGIGVRSQQQTQVFFGRGRVGVYLSNLVIDGNVLVEIKRAEQLTDREKDAFGAFVRDGRYARGYLFNFAADDLEVARFVGG